MTLRTLHQSFPTNGYTPAKVELYLRKVEATVAAPFPLSKTLDCVIDAPNFAYMDASKPRSALYQQGVANGQTGSGYMSWLSAGSTVSYPIQATNDGFYNVWIRVRSSTASVAVRVYMDNALVSTINCTGLTSSAWSWFNGSVIFPDKESHVVTIAPQAACDLDMLVVTRATVPTGSGPSFSDPAYSTVHAKLWPDSSDAPYMSAESYDAISTYTHIQKSDWYTFDFTPITALSAGIEMGVVVNVSGSSASRNIVWEEAATYTTPSSTKLDYGSFTVDAQNSLALRVYNSHSSLSAGTNVTPDAKIVANIVDDFDSTIQPVLQNAIITTDAYDSGGNDVQLDVTDKLISFVVDQSGSQTWNDSENIRLAVLHDILDTLEGRYPANLRCNLFKVKGEKSFSIFVPLKTQPPSLSIADIVKASFAGDAQDFAGFRVLRKEGSYPTTPIDGEIVSDGYMLAALDTGLTTGTHYYYTVYIYDQLYRFSKGVQINVPAANKVIPRGIPSFLDTVYSGYGPRRDSNTVGLWHMDEGSGNYVFDFSDSNLPLSLTDTRWLDLADSPIGNYGIRLNGVNSALTSAVTSELAFGRSQPFSLIFTVQPFNTATVAPLIVRSTSGHFNWGIAVDHLKIRFYGGSSNSVISNISLNVNEWNTVGFVYNGNSTLDLYINGVHDSTLTVPNTLPTWDTANAAINIGVDPSGTISGHFFGKLTHLSVHNIALDSSYVGNALVQNKNLRDQSAADNGDRLVVLNWNIPVDYNFVGGQVRLVQNRNRPPMHESDGTILTQTSASYGSFTYEAPQDYDLGHTYYFRLFSQNTSGNWSAIEDSALLTVPIPGLVWPAIDITTDSGDIILQPSGPGFGSFPSVTVTEARAGNEKVWLEWTVPSDPQISRVVVYYRPDGFPYYDGKTKSIVGEIVWDMTKDLTDFVHRNLPNYDTAYYAVVTIDKYGHFSPLTTSDINGNPLRFVPLDTLDDTGIPLLEALNVRYHIMDSDQIEIAWDSPVKFNTSLDGWFDDEFYLYAAICDLYGDPLNIDFPSGFSITPTVGNVQATSVEDAFNLGATTDNLNQLPNASFAVASNLASGTIKLRSGGSLAILESLTINIAANYKINENFTYTLPNLTVTFNNPLALRLINRDGQYLSVKTFGDFDCTVDVFSGDPNVKPDNRRSVNGCYIRRMAPFAVRAEFTYKGNPIPRPAMQIRIYDAVGRDSVDVDPCGLTPNLKGQSSYVKLLNPQPPFALEQLPILDSEGNPTGFTHPESYADLLVIAPRLPQSAAVFVLISNQGYNIVSKINLFFANILQITTSLFAPNPDGLDVREEYARVTLIDPDHPDDPALISTAPDLTVVQWVIARPQGANVNVPFYSTDDVPLGNGIYSYTRRGTARQVFFGPAGNGAAGDYTITVSTTVSDLFATATGTVTIQGVTGTTYHLPIPDPEAPRIYCELDQAAAQSAYADGVEFVKMWIFRNIFTAVTITSTTPNHPNPDFVSCFESCSHVFVPLNVGQTVHIEAAGWEIISGAVIENADGTIDVTNANVDEDTSDVKLLRGDYTNVWFRANREVDPKFDVCAQIGGSNQCHCPLPEQLCGESTSVVVSTKINYNGKPLVIYGGGALLDGRPPTVIAAKEPLHINFIGIQANGQMVSDIIVDGKTQNVIVSEVTWEGGTVPDGTPVTVDVTDSKNALGKGVADIVTFPTIGYVKNINDPLINPTGRVRSFVKVVLPVLPTDISYAVILVFTTTYNAVGNVARKKQYGIKFTYYIQQPLIAGPPSPAITDSLERFDVNAQTWTTKASMHHARAAFAMAIYHDKLFAVSGTDGSQLLSSVERYEIAGNTWYDMSPISVPRMYAQTAVIGQYLYVIGGLTSDAAGNLTITPAVERYDMANDAWVRLSDMPTNYAVVLGVAGVYNGKISILSGYANQLNTYNDSVLTYDPGNDTWAQGTPFTGDDLASFQRLGAFGVQNGNVLYAIDGLYYLPPVASTDSFPGEPEVRIYLADAYSYDLSTDTFANASQSFEDLPRARFLGQNVEVGNTAYFIGGTNQDTNTLRYFEAESLVTTPFTYSAFTKMQRGRSSFGAAAEPTDAYGEAIWIAGGVTNRQASNFLVVNTDAVPQTLGLDGIQTGAINITVYDENGDSPSSIVVRVTGSAGSDYDPVIFTEDNITIVDGFAVATLMPRADDPPTALLGEGAAFTTYAVSVTGAILDATYYGETDAATIGAGASGFINPNTGAPNVNVAVNPLIELGTVIRQNFASGGAVLTVSNINNIIDLNPSGGASGHSTTVQYTATNNWLPQVESLIDDNESSLDDVRALLTRMDKEVPFGGTPLLDGLNAAAQIMILDGTGDRRVAVAFTDGIDNDSNAQIADVQKSFDTIAGPAETPVVAAIFKVVPSVMHLDKGVRQASAVMDQLTSETGGGDRYITSDLDIADTVRNVISTTGFIGAGYYECIIDLGDLVLIDSLSAIFELLDSDADAKWRFALAADDLVFGDYSDYQTANSTLPLVNTVARYVKLQAVLIAQLSIYVYGEGKLIPPVLEQFTINYHKPTTSYIFLDSEIPDDEVSQVILSLDVNRPQGSEVQFGYSSFKGTSFEDYYTEDQPAADNGSRIIVPLRRSLDIGKTNTLETAQSIDGFIFEVAYGPWPTDATVAVYQNGVTLVDPATYQTFPDLGYVVFSTKTTQPYVVSITSKPSVNLAVKVTNRIAGEPVVIASAGYMYSTLKQQTSAVAASRVIPQAINLLVLPLQPDVASTFIAQYTYYDLSGRDESGTTIRWYVNSVVKTDINDLPEWDNNFWNFAKAGDQVYFTVTPANNTYTGVTVRSLPVTVSA